MVQTLKPLCLANVGVLAKSHMSANVAMSVYKDIWIVRLYVTLTQLGHSWQSSKSAFRRNK